MPFDHWRAKSIEQMVSGLAIDRCVNDCNEEKALIQTKYFLKGKKKNWGRFLCYVM
jgi:hypothetical protein